MASGKGDTDRNAAAERCGLVVAGGGINGLSLALAVRAGFGQDLPVAVVDPGLFRRDPSDARAYALAPGAKRMFEALGVWREAEAFVEPIREMVITDSRAHDVVRPSFLTFAGEQGEGEPLAYMIAAEDLTAVLERHARAACIRLAATRVEKATPGPAAITVALADGTALTTPLLVAADGGRSPLREAAGIDWIGWDYGQSGIVATIGHDRPHHGRAYEHFLPSGPFAILPLPDAAEGRHRSSIVWSERRRDVEPLMALDPEDLLAEVETRFGLEFGAIALLDTPRAFPLRYGVARRFAGDRLALLGDAAHQVHPIAGQGLNLGLKDVAALAEIVVDAARLGLDIGAPTVLERYESARRADTVLMGLAMDGLNRLFSNDLLPVRLLRDFGLGVVDRLAPLKRFFAGHAAGDDARLMRGEAL